MHQPFDDADDCECPECSTPPAFHIELTEAQMAHLVDLVGPEEWQRQAEKYAAWQAANPGKTIQQAFFEMCDAMEPKP